MQEKIYPVIDLVATGQNIRRLRMACGLSVRDLQNYFGFEEPRAIYKWQKGETLPSVDNLYALGFLFEVSMDQILVSTAQKINTYCGQQAETCCSTVSGSIIVLLGAFVIEPTVHLFISLVAAFLLL